MKRKKRKYNCLLLSSPVIVNLDRYGRMDCLCVGKHCIAYDGSAALIEIWEYLAGPTEDPTFLKAMGFQGMTDEVYKILNITKRITSFFHESIHIFC